MKKKILVKNSKKYFFLKRYCFDGRDLLLGFFDDLKTISGPQSMWPLFTP
jgi:hypothetical protein